MTKETKRIQQELIDSGYRSVIDENFKLRAEIASLKQSAPLTPEPSREAGRTYTEGEVEQIAKDYVFNIYEVIDGQEVFPYLNKRDGDLGVRAAVAVWKIMNNIPLTKL